MNKFNYNFVVTLGKLLFPVGWFEILAKMNPFVVTRNDQLQFTVHNKRKDNSPIVDEEIRFGEHIFVKNFS